MAIYVAVDCKRDSKQEQADVFPKVQKSETAMAHKYPVGARMCHAYCFGKNSDWKKM